MSIVPREVLHMIFYRAGPCCFQVVRMVCRQWKRVVESDEFQKLLEYSGLEKCFSQRHYPMFSSREEMKHAVVCWEKELPTSLWFITDKITAQLPVHSKWFPPQFYCADVSKEHRKMVGCEKFPRVPSLVQIQFALDCWTNQFPVLSFTSFQAQQNTPLASLASLDENLHEAIESRRDYPKITRLSEADWNRAIRETLH